MEEYYDFEECMTDCLAEHGGDDPDAELLCEMECEQYIDESPWISDSEDAGEYE